MASASGSFGSAVLVKGTMPALTLYEKARALAALMVAAKCLNLYTFRCTTANSLSMQFVRGEPAVP